MQSNKSHADPFSQSDVSIYRRHVAVGSGCLRIDCFARTFIVHSKATEPKPEIRVLFIGNSFTFYHDLPKMVAELAEAGEQRPLHFDSETPGGYTLEKHWQDGKAVAKIQSGRWDYRGAAGPE